ncbi:MAG: peptide chain release factor 2 [Abditibacteriota bacterium]|nr:peptide chain release factor 2 [Abditibacteriota bacterium]
MIREIFDRASALKSKLAELGKNIDPERLRDQIDKLESDSAEPEFWNDADNAKKVLKEIANLKQTLEPYDDIKERAEMAAELAEITDDGTSDAEDLRAEMAEIEEAFDKLELDTLLSGENDGANAIMELNAGAGGTEACDWTDMLMRMFLRYAERMGYKTDILNTVEGDVAGIKNVTIRVAGHNAYGYLKNERGVHRLVRISPFDANKRRHTSFAAVDVIPELDDDIEVNISPDDIRVDTYRSSGAGGQHVNKTDSAIRITHIPTGIVVSCQNERSQHANKDSAMKVLASRLRELEQEKNEQRMAEIRGDLRAIEWGSQIRSYVFQPYTMVKDHRTECETGDVNKVMDGGLEPFIQASLRAAAKPKE